MTRLIVVILALISVAYGAKHFRYPTNTSEAACVLATFDAGFNLTFSEGNDTVTNSWSLPAVGSVKVGGNCEKQGGPATLVLTFSDTDLTFTFTEAGEMVTAELQYLLKDPSKSFPGINYTEPVNLVGPGDELDLGNANKSYLCIAPDVIRLASNESKENISAAVDITFTNFQIQAFGVKSDNFSDDTECSADKTSTTASTTPSTTTVVPTPSGVANYTLTTNNGTVVCLRLQANISMVVHYHSKKGDLMNRTIMVPDNANVSGECGETMTNLILTFSDEAEKENNGTLEFVFEKMKDYAFVSSVHYDLQFTDANDSVSGEIDANDVLAQSDDFYTCNEELYTDKDVEIALQELKVQAFNLKDGEFGKTGVDCKAPVPKKPTTGNFTVRGENNVTCISVSVALTLQINYTTTENKNESVRVNFTKDEPADGHCSDANNTNEEIIIRYRKRDFSVSMVFEKSSSSVSASLGADDSPGFYVKNITVTYKLVDEIFPKAKQSEEMMTAKLTNAKLFETGSSKYYKCSSVTTVKVDDYVNLITQDLRMVAFNTNAKQPNLDGDNAEECAADTETNSIVPIAVGAALAGLVVIVLIAYLIGRRRNHKGYESV